MLCKEESKEYICNIIGQKSVFFFFFHVKRPENGEEVFLNIRRSP
jgi:hypothetical protein